VSPTFTNAPLHGDVNPDTARYNSEDFAKLYNTMGIY